jgi:hypothetical protein
MSKQLLLIIGLVIITIFGLSRSGLYPKSTTPNPQTNPNQGNWQRIISSDAIFVTKIFLDRSSTYITVPIRFDDNPKVSWISLDSTSSSVPHAFLMTHPQLETLDWPTVKKDLITLYQRQETYPSIEAFVTNPPPRNRTAIEDGIKQLDYYKNVPGYPIDQAFDVNNVDYILTTYVKPKTENGIYYYENIIDASEASVDHNNNLGWRITVPDTSSASAYYLGQIHIDYHRDK